MATAQMPFLVNQNGQQVETAAGWISCILTGLRRPFRGVRGGQRSFRLCGGLPRGSALLGDRQPFLQRCPAAVHTRAKGFRAGRQNLTFVAVPHEKRNTSRRPPSALIHSPMREKTFSCTNTLTYTYTETLLRRAQLKIPCNMQNNNTTLHACALPFFPRLTLIWVVPVRVKT